MTDDTVVCRCEEVTGAEIREAIADGALSLTEVRAATRSGMGLCQGRWCSPTVAALVARWAGVTPEAAGRLTARPPVRPIAVRALTDEGADEPTPAARD